MLTFESTKEILENDLKRRSTLKQLLVTRPYVKPCDEKIKAVLDQLSTLGNYDLIPSNLPITLENLYGKFDTITIRKIIEKFDSIELSLEEYLEKEREHFEEKMKVDGFDIEDYLNDYTLMQSSYIENVSFNSTLNKVVRATDEEIVEDKIPFNNFILYTLNPTVGDIRNSQTYYNRILTKEEILQSLYIYSDHNKILFDMTLRRILESTLLTFTQEEMEIVGVHIMNADTNGRLNAISRYMLYDLFKDNLNMLYLLCYNIDGIFEFILRNRDKDFHIGYLNAYPESRTQYETILLSKASNKYLLSAKSEEDQLEAIKTSILLIDEISRYSPIVYKSVLTYIEKHFAEHPMYRKDLEDIIYG